MEQPEQEESLGVTSRGLKWEYLQSWYFVCGLTVWTYWIPLVYTGIRIMDLRWIFWGLLYGIPSFLYMAVDLSRFGMQAQLTRAVYVALLFSLIHAIRARTEFLERLVAYQDEAEEAHQANLARRALAEAQRRGQPVEPAAPRTIEVVEAPAAVAQRALFDVNVLGVNDFAMLPDMGPETARQAVAMRERLGSFTSFDHFADKMGLAAKTRERLRPLFIQPAVAQPGNASDEFRTLPDGSRVLELNLASADAMATLPGLDWELGKKAVQLREAGGPFKSIEDFRYRLGLSMDQLVALHPLVSTHRTPVTSSTPGVKPSGRIVDV